MSTTAEVGPNGVNVTRLGQTMEAIKDDPELATFTFRATNTWLGGGHSRSRVQGFWGAGSEDASREEPFILEGDEPPVLLGSDTAPNAVETVLHALASCLAVGLAYNAAARGITVRSLEFELEGELDLHGFLGLSDRVRPGYSSVRVGYRIDADATGEQLDELCAYVQRTSPVADILRNPVDVTISGQRVAR